MANPALDDVSTLINQQQLDEALATIKVLHISYHRQALIHQQVHVLWLTIAYKKGDLRMMIGQILPLLFAMPISLFHRSFGFAIKAHKTE